MFDKEVFWLITFNDSTKEKLLAIIVVKSILFSGFYMTKEHSNNTGFYYFIQNSKRTP